MSLKWKTALSLLFFASILIPVSFEFVLSGFADHQHKEFIKADNKVLTNIATVATELLLNSHLKLTDKVSLDKLNQYFLVYTTLPRYKGFSVNQDGRMILSTSDNVDRLNNAGYIRLEKHIIPEKKLSIVMFVDSPSTDEQFYIMLGYNPLILLTLILIFTIIGYYNANDISQQIEGLVVGISKAGGGNYNQRMLVTGDDELTQLSISYNRMLDNLQLTSQEMREEIQNFRSILESAPIGIIIYNDRGVIESFNRTAAGIFGTSAAGVIGTNIKQLFPLTMEAGNGITETQNLQLLIEALPVSTEYTARRHQTELFPISISVTKTSISNSSKFTAFLKDISEKKNIASQHQELESQLLSLQRKNIFTKHSENIVHELNNIFGPILGYADLAMEESKKGSTQYKYIHHVLDGANRAKQLISQITNFTKAEDLQITEFHLIPVVKEVIPLLKSTLSSKYNIESVYISANDRVIADKTRVAQLLIMLVDYAETDIVGDVLSILVDNWVDDKQPAEQAAVVRIIVEFQSQNESSEESKEYHGLEELAQSMGCGLSMDITDDKLYRYSILLPADIKEEDSTTGLKKILAKNRETILYIDDDLESAELGQEQLEGIGYHVDIETKSQAALEIIQDKPDKYNLIITDQSMPEMMGTELAMEIKKLKPEMPIILVTGFSSSVRDSDLKASGIEYCVAKPIVIDEFGELLIKLLSGNQ